MKCTLFYPYKYRYHFGIILPEYVNFHHSALARVDNLHTAPLLPIQEVDESFYDTDDELHGTSDVYQPSLTDYEEVDSSATQLLPKQKTNPSKTHNVFLHHEVHA